MNKVINLDTAATTPVREEVLLAMKPYWSNKAGNPSSITKGGVIARQAVENSRKIIAGCLKARPQEIIFTGSGTESNNLAILGVVNNLEKQGKKISDLHFITTNIEHSSVTECFKKLERRGAKVDYLKVNELGLVQTKDLRKLIKSNTALISVGYVNGEIGVIQPIKEIAREIRHARKTNKILEGEYPYFHTDASQAGLYCNLSTNELGADLLTLDAQKIYGPKGVGIIFIKAGTNISPIILGGGQEGGLRSGTENVPLIVGMAKAVEICRSGHPSLDKEGKGAAEKVRNVRDYFWQKIQKDLPARAGIPAAVLNGDLENRLPNNLNISILGIDSEFTVLCLDEAGIVCSTKSACNHEEDESFVVQALGGGEGRARSTLRFTLGSDITKKDVDFVVLTLKSIIKKQAVI